MWGAWAKRGLCGVKKKQGFGPRRSIVSRRCPLDMIMVLALSVEISMQSRSSMFHARNAVKRYGELTILWGCGNSLTFPLSYALGNDHVLNLQCD